MGDFEGGEIPKSVVERGYERSSDICVNERQLFIFSCVWCIVMFVHACHRRYYLVAFLFHYHPQCQRQWLWGWHALEISTSSLLKHAWMVGSSTQEYVSMGQDENVMCYSPHCPNQTGWWIVVAQSPSFDVRLARSLPTAAFQFPFYFTFKVKRTARCNKSFEHDHHRRQLPWDIKRKTKVACVRLRKKLTSMRQSAYASVCWSEFRTTGGPGQRSSTSR